jgi:hypothetical protein
VTRSYQCLMVSWDLPTSGASTKGADFFADRRHAEPVDARRLFPAVSGSGRRPRACNRPAVRPWQRPQASKQLRESVQN